MALKVKGNSFHTKTGLNIEKTFCDIIGSPERTPGFISAMKSIGVINEDGGIGSLSGLDDVDNPMFTFPVIGNEFISAMFNKVGYVWVRNALAKNKLSVFKTGQLPWGSFTEETHTNPSKENAFDFTGGSLLSQTKPDVKVAYHQINRQKQFETTIQLTLLRRAFHNAEGAGALIDTLIGANYNGNTIQEWLLTKQLLGSSVGLNKIVKQIIDDPTSSESAARAFTAKIRSLSNSFEEPTIKYNAYLQYADADSANPRWSWVSKADQIIIIPHDLEAYLDVNVLAYAYNMSKAEFEQKVITIDQFEDADGVPVNNVYAMLMDKTFASIKTSVEQSSEFYNPKNLAVTHYLTVFQSFSVSPFANAVALISGT